MANGVSSPACGRKEQQKAGMKKWQMAAASDAPSLLLLLLLPISSVLHPFSTSSASFLPPCLSLSSLLLRSTPHPSPIPTCVEAMLVEASTGQTRVVLPVRERQRLRMRLPVLKVPHAEALRHMRA
ncbi:hypothetical protein B0H14DRAFT_3485898 [Mycena olivaceomarginata]|nr:hypothetical protein B0H14DRAFT_3485898 [Mycena olivaceomarginata]